MKPHGFVDIFARLLSDAELRRRFISDRTSTLTEFGLDETDAQLLCRISDDQLEQQARGLLLKRQSEVADKIPQTWKRLGQDARQLFQTYAQQSPWPEGHRKHLLDAVAFCRFLKRQRDLLQVGQPVSNQGARDGKTTQPVVNSEFHWIRFVGENRSFRIAIARDLEVDEKPNFCLQIFYRNRKRMPRHFVFFMPFLGSVCEVWARVFKRKRDVPEDK